MLAPATPRTRRQLALRLQCRNEWATGQGTLAEVAKRHNVPPQTLVAWYRRENWTDARNRWLAKQLSDNETPAKPPAYAAKPKYSDDDTHARKIQRLETQLESLDSALDNARTADDWHKLSTARQRLFEQWRILSGIPLPGSRRPSKERPRRQAYYEPVSLAPAELREAEPRCGTDDEVKWEMQERSPGIFTQVVLSSPAQASEPAAAAPGQPAVPVPNASRPTCTSNNARCPVGTACTCACYVGVIPSDSENWSSASYGHTSQRQTGLRASCPDACQASLAPSSQIGVSLSGAFGSHRFPGSLPWRRSRNRASGTSALHLRESL